MRTAAELREHYRKVRERLQPVTSVYDPEAPYLKCNRKHHNPIDQVLTVDRSYDHPKAPRVSLMQQKRAAAKRTQDAARKRRWEKNNADDLVESNGGAGPNGGHSTHSQFTAKGSAAGFQAWLAKQRGDHVPTGNTSGDEPSAAPATAAHGSQGENPVIPTSSTETPITLCDQALVDAPNKIED